MAKRYYVRTFDSGELANTNMFIRFKPNKNVAVTQIRTELFFFDYTSALTGLTGKIYSDNADSEPGAVVYSSTSTYAKADIITENTGVKNVPFNFNYVNLNKDTWYNFVLSASSYTFGESDYIAWRKAWPDPVYTTNLTVDFELMSTSPFWFALMGEEI